MKKLIVDVVNYAPHPYPEYFNRGVEIAKPENAPFEIGEVVVITGDDGLVIGVVIGFIDESYGDLRTDMSGIVSMDNIQPATLNDFSIPGILFNPRLLEECQKLNSEI